MTTETATTTPGPSVLGGAILDAQLAHILTVIDRAKAGASREELDRAGAAANARIRAELVEPFGEAGRVAADESADRMLAGVRLLAAHFGVDLDADDD